MKYADMQRSIEADAYAKASGRKAEQAPIREAAPRPDTSDRVQFRMWKSARSTPECQYVASLKLTRDLKAGDILIIEAYVVETPEGSKGFEGRSYGPGGMLKRASVTGDPRALPPQVRDLLSPLEELPFNDPLPADMVRTP